MPVNAMAPSDQRDSIAPTRPVRSTEAKESADQAPVPMTSPSITPTNPPSSSITDSRAASAERWMTEAGWMMTELDSDRWSIAARTAPPGPMPVAVDVTMCDTRCGNRSRRSPPKSWRSSISAGITRVIEVARSIGSEPSARA